MKPQHTPKTLMTAIVLGMTALGINSAWAQTTQPAQTPLMNAAAGAVPNVMINLDNSGSMSFPFLDTYPNTLVANREYAMRSAGVNPMYYNPRIYYAPRVNPDGTDHTPPLADATSGVATAQSPGRCKITNIRRRGNQFVRGAFATDCTSRSSWAANRNLVFLANWGNTGQEIFVDRNDIQRTGGNWVIRFNPTVGNSSDFRTTTGNPVVNATTYNNYPVPAHLEFSNISNVGSQQYFRYVTGCTTINACENASSRTVVDVLPNGQIRLNENATSTSTTVTLPAGSNRPDCGTNATTCTWAQENANIIRWYNFYSTRMKAVATAIGQSLSQPQFTNKLRVGYSQINDTAGAAARGIVRGVRYWRDTGGNNWKTQAYNWLYSIGPNGGTPVHMAIENVANYYGTNAPWKTDPTSGGSIDTSKDLACRRAYHILLSDGAWNGDFVRNGININFPSGVAINQANRGGQPFTSNLHGSFTYSPDGNTQNRSQYISYADPAASRSRAAQRGLADLTAHYFWNTDFSTLRNEVPPIPSANNPTFWQNMTTYNIGWGLAPGAGATSSLSTGLTGMESTDLVTYKRNWLSGNPSTINWANNPSWGTTLTNADFTAAASQDRINDFIRSGYTGGGKTLSVFSAAEVTRAFNEILGQITSSGNDAGVAVSGNNTGGNENLEDQLRYNVTYETASNSGAIEAYNIQAATNAQGEKTYSVGTREWAATVNPVASRQLYALSGTVGSFSNQTLAANTALSSLPADLAALLNSDGNQPTDNAFIRYILGEEGVADANGTLYRSRASDIGASVNSPPTFVGGDLNMGYATMGDVEGKTQYQAYLNDKRSGKTTIFAATNEGMVHVFNSGRAANQGGLEVAAYMPRGAMAQQTALANAGFRFRYVLDGPLAAKDMYDAQNSKWRQVVTGTGGRGGKYAYAIESPLNGGGDRTPNASNFLWDIRSTDSGYADMGYITNLSTSGQLQDGSWVTLMPSGHYAGTNKVGLYVVNALTGQRKYFIQIPATYAQNNRGLGGVVAVRDNNREIVAAYAGDANGNVWRFDLRNSAGKTPKLSYGEPLFITDDDDDDKDGKREQPIYAAPAWQVHPEAGTIVNVATGILLEDADITDLDEDNAIYGLWDPTPIGGDDLSASELAVFRDGKFTIDDDDLYERELEKITVTPTTPNTDSKGNTYYRIKKGVIDWTKTKEENGKQVKANRGWELELGEVKVANVGEGGERVIGDLHYAGSALVVPSVFVPNSTSTTVESCNSTGLANMLYVIDAVTGAPTKAFKEYKASAVLLPRGGFTRGLVVRNTGGSESIGEVNEGYPDGRAKKCVPFKGPAQGAGGFTPVIDNQCPTGWVRTWRTIINSPFSNG